MRAHLLGAVAAAILAACGASPTMPENAASSPTESAVSDESSRDTDPDPVPTSWDVTVQRHARRHGA